MSTIWYERVKDESMLADCTICCVKFALCCGGMTVEAAWPFPEG